MKNNKSLQASMDRRLSFLDQEPSCRPALLQRIAQEEEPEMKKKLSFSLVIALALVSLSIIAVAAGLLLSPRVTATRMADRALTEVYGVTDEMQTFFAREETELPDGAVQVTYTGAGGLDYVLGTYTAIVRDGKAEITWSHDGEEIAEGYASEVWGPEQMKQMMAVASSEESKKAYLALALEISEKHASSETEETPADDSPYDYEGRETEKTAALQARRLSEEEMVELAREFIISSFELTEAQISRLELFTNFTPLEENAWYETVNGKPCFLVEYLLDEEDFTPEMEQDENYVRNNSYYKIFVNVETGVIEQYEYNSGKGGLG